MRQLLYCIKVFHVCQQLFYFFFCRCEAVLHTTALIEYHIHPSLSTAFLFDFAIHFFFAVLSEFSKLICSEILQFFKIFARMTSACYSLVSVSISERMLSYHGFSELSMLFYILRNSEYSDILVLQLSVPVQPSV